MVTFGRRASRARGTVEVVESRVAPLRSPGARKPSDHDVPADRGAPGPGGLEVHARQPDRPAGTGDHDVLQPARSGPGRHRAAAGGVSLAQAGVHRPGRDLRSPDRARVQIPGRGRADDRRGHEHGSLMPASSAATDSAADRAPSTPSAPAHSSTPKSWASTTPTGPAPKVAPDQPMRFAMQEAIRLAQQGLSTEAAAYDVLRWATRQRSVIQA